MLTFQAGGIHLLARSQVSRDRVVISDGQQVYLALTGQRHEFAGAKGTIRSGTMGMEVNQHNLYTWSPAAIQAVGENWRQTPW